LETDYRDYRAQFDRKKPLPGGFPPWVISNKEPGRRGPPTKNKPIFLNKIAVVLERGPLPPGSSFGNHPRRKPPQWGGFLSIKVTQLNSK